MSRYDRQKADLLDSGMDEKCANFWTGTARAQREAMRKRGQRVPRDKYSAPKKIRIGPSEAEIQSAFFDLVRAHVGQYPDLRLIRHIPMGGYRPAWTGANLRRQGAKRGTLDVQMLVPRGGYHGWVAEFKVPGGGLRPEQKEDFAACVKNGYAVFVFTDAQEAFDNVINYLNMP